MCGAVLFFLLWPFPFFRAVGSIRPAAYLQDDSSFDEAIEESHRQRTVGQVVSPFIKIYVRNQRGGALLIS